jgi:biopolymer transport protein ExbD
MPLKIPVEDPPTMNLTAMLDVMFLLIIFFVLNTKFLDDERQIQLQVPQVNDKNAAASSGDQKTVNVFRDGTMTFDGSNVSLKELPARLAAARAGSPKLSVLVRGDAQGELQHVTDVLSACKQAGVADLGISVRLTTDRR